MPTLIEITYTKGFEVNYDYVSTLEEAIKIKKRLEKKGYKVTVK